MEDEKLNEFAQEIFSTFLNKSVNLFFITSYKSFFKYLTQFTFILKKPNYSEQAFENEFENDEIEKLFAEDDNKRNVFEKISRFI